MPPVEAFLNFFRQGDYDSAELEARQLVGRLPQEAFGWKALGAVLKLKGQLHDSLEPMIRATQLDPTDAEAYSNLGTTLHDLGDLQQAIVCYEKAISLNSGHAEAHCNLGVALRDMGRFSEAKVCYLKALELRPNYHHAWSNLGNIEQIRGDIAAAVACYERALQINPTFLEARSNLLFSLNYVYGIDGDTFLKLAKQYGQLVSQMAVPKFTSWSQSTSSRLRIGFVSGDLKCHPVGFFTEGLFAHLDRQRFSLHAFPTTFEVDDLTQRVMPYFDDWLPLTGLSDLQAASLIHNTRIDILIDLSGHTSYNRLGVFAFRPAPVQVSWLGYFASTGLPEMDYFLGDSILAPQSEQAYFSERLVALPKSWFSFAPPTDAPDPGVPPLLRNGYVTFGCFGNLAKMNDHVVLLWASVLKALPDARLFLKANQLGDEAITESVYARFAQHAIEKHRLVLSRPSDRADYFAAYGEIDIVLDTFPYPGGTTSVEALWMGVPIVTLKGGRFLSRLGESVLHYAGLGSLVVLSPDHYIAKAIEVSKNLDELKLLRKTLRQRLLQSSLFQVPSFAQGFGETMVKLAKTRA